MSKQLTGGQDRRTFLKVLVAVGGAAAMPLPRRAAAQAPKVVTIRTGFTPPPGHPYEQLLRRWADSVIKKTGGAYNFQIHGGGVLGSGRTAPEGVAIGTIESYFADPSEYASFNQALNILSAPFIWNDRNQLQRAVRDPAIINTLYDPVIKKGFRPLAHGYVGTRHLTTKNTPAMKPADVKGLKIRVPEIPVYRDMVTAWGATPTPIPAADLFMALQTGTVEAQENPFAQILSFKLYEVQKYLILTSHIIQCGAIIFNEKLFQAQPKEHQQILTESAQEAMDWFLESLTAQEATMLEQIKGYGMVVLEPDRVAFRETMKPVYEKYDHIWTKELREKIQAYK